MRRGPPTALGPARLPGHSRWCAAVLATCVAGAPVQVHAQAAAQVPAQAAARAAAPASQTELLRGAQMWAAKNRADLARQLLEKLLLADR